MVQRAGRVTCPKCGANNFDTVTTCYRCNASLISGAQPSGGGQGGIATAPERGGRPVPMNAPLPPAMNAPGQAPMMPPAPAYMPDYGGGGGGDPGVARRAAVMLALTIPWLGLPVGWAFMMMEDRKRQAIGRYCVNWSLIALVFHLLLSFVFVQSLSSYLPMILGMTKALQQKQNAPQPDMGGTGLP